MAHNFITSHNFQNPPTYPFSFQRYFFNEVEHLQNQGGSECYTFYCQNTENQTIDIRFSVIIENQMAYSPLRATFGGVEFKEDISEKNLLVFLEEVVENLSKIPIKEIIINSYPEGYRTERQNQKLENCLLRLGFHNKYSEDNYEISVTEKSFQETIISSNHKRILRKSMNNNFVFKKEISPNLVEIHAFIECSRVRKNRPMTMTLKQLEEHFKKFPKNFQLFSVYDSEERMAVCVTVEINDKILYTLYPADAEEYVMKSPLTFLFSGIYEYCQQHKYEILDLGIATNKGVLNEGLARFKRNLGGKLSNKKAYCLSLKSQFYELT